MSRSDMRQIIAAGTILIIEHGEYSDFGYSGPVRMLKSASKDQLAGEYREHWKAKPKDAWDTSPSPSDFLPWLISSGYAEDLGNVQSWHVGSYGDFEP